MAWTFQKESSVAKAVAAIEAIPAPSDPNEATMVTAFKNFATTDLAPLVLPPNNNVISVTASGESTPTGVTMQIYFRTKFVDM